MCTLWYRCFHFTPCTNGIIIYSEDNPYEVCDDLSYDYEWPCNDCADDGLWMGGAVELARGDGMWSEELAIGWYEHYGGMWEEVDEGEYEGGDD